MRSRVEDYREVQILKLRHSMSYSGFTNQSLQWGFEFGYQKADYRYAGAAEYFGFTATYPRFAESKRLPGRRDAFWVQLWIVCKQ